MDNETKAFGRMVDYRVGEVTAAAPPLMAQRIYAKFSQACAEQSAPAEYRRGGSQGLRKQSSPTPRTRSMRRRSRVHRRPDS